MSDTEKKIAEIQKSAEEARKTKGTWVDGQDYADDVEFLLNELERLEREYAEERAAHNAHVTELCELEQERNMYKSSSEVFYERLKKEAEQREKLVECLRFYERMARGREANDGGRRARTIFAEIGVTVE
jgi:hypothetical protein